VDKDYLYSQILMKKILIILFLLITVPTGAGHKRLEKEYQKEWCESMGGKSEYALPDKTRIDCLTEEYAVEVEFAENWAEAIGQALYYAAKTGKLPGIVLIMEDKKDKRYLDRLNKVIKTYKLPIRIWKEEGSW
jgi:hypothetical protein